MTQLSYNEDFQFDKLSSTFNHKQRTFDKSLKQKTKSFYDVQSQRKARKKYKI